MKRLKVIVCTFILVMFMPTAYPHGVHQSVVIEIDYGRELPFREAEVEWHQGMTALEALQSIADVKTKPFEGFILVTSIDGVTAQRGGMAWYYDVNGKRANNFANRYVLQEGDHMRWSYTKDVCSHRIEEGAYK